jgi:hypothetical protein
MALNKKNAIFSKEPTVTRQPSQATFRVPPA